VESLERILTNKVNTRTVINTNAQADLFMESLHLVRQFKKTIDSKLRFPSGTVGTACGRRCWIEGPKSSCWPPGHSPLEERAVWHSFRHTWLGERPPMTGSTEAHMQETHGSPTKLAIVHTILQNRTTRSQSPPGSVSPERALHQGMSQGLTAAHPPKSGPALTGGAETKLPSSRQKQRFRFSKLCWIYS